MIWAHVRGRALIVIQIIEVLLYSNSLVHRSFRDVRVKFGFSILIHIVSYELGKKKIMMNLVEQ